MLKIEEIHPSSSVQGEYVVLQNQGLMTITLKGWALCSDVFLEGDNAQIADKMYVFRDEEQIKPYTRVVLFTGTGKNGWVPTVDGRVAYCAYWGREERVWTLSSHVHVLHLFTSRRVTPSTAASSITRV